MAEALLVEHDATCRRLFATVVKSCGFDVRTAGDGRDALTEIRRRRPDAILLDLDLDGVHILRELASAAPDLLDRIIVVTADGNSSLHESEPLRQVRRVLQKPLEVGALMRELRALK